jgi:DNA-binding NtrC family response regulator/HAMP domain-containing protein
MHPLACQFLAAMATLAPAPPREEVVACPAAAGPIVVDGNLGEWRLSESDYQALSGADPALPQKDLSASAAVRFDGDALYLAVRLQDEQRIVDTPNFWDADGLDLWFEPPTGVRGAAGRTRLVLLPFNSGRRFGVITWQGKQVLGAGGMNGVELAARELAEGSGAFAIEARVPLRPLGIEPRDGAEIGFELSIRDHDGGERSDGEAPPPERALLSWSGRTDLSPGAGALPRLRFAGEPRPERGSDGWRDTTLGVTAALAVLLLSWLVGKSARRAQRAVQSRLRSWRAYGLAAFGAIALLLALGVDVAESIATWRTEAALLERGGRVAVALAELEKGEVAARMRGADDATLRELLEGRPLAVAESNRFEPVAVLADEERGPGDYRSLDPIAGVPFSEYGVRLGGSRDAPDSVQLLDVRLEAPQRVRRVHLAVAGLLPGAARAGSGQIVDAVEAQLRFAQRPADAVQVRRFTIDDARSDPVGHQERTWGRARLRAGPRDEPWLATEIAGQELRHVDHFVVEVEPPAAAAATEGEAALERITLLPTKAAAAATLWVSGVTLELAGPTPRYVPLALGSSDRNGYPLPMRAGRPAPREVRAVPKGGGEATRTLLYGRPGQPPLELQRLRVYYRAEGPVLRALADTATLRVRAWFLVALEGQAEPLRIPLRAGLEIDDAQLYEPQHPASMTSFLAATFETRQGLLHYDGFELPLPAAAGGAPLRIARVELEQPPESRGALVVAGMSALVHDQPPPAPQLEALVVGDGKLALAAPVRAALADADPEVGFAIARGGVIRQVGGAFPAGEVQRLVGTGWTRGGEPSKTPQVVREQRLGREWLTVPLPVALGGAACDVVLFCERPTLSGLRAGRGAAAWIVGLLALPFALLLIVDALARVARVRTRLSFLFLFTSLAPLIVLFAVLANVVAGEQQLGEERRAGEMLAQLRGRAERLCELATDHAQRTLRELEASEILTARVGDDEVRRRLKQMAQAFPDPDVTIAIVVEAPSEAGEARRIHSDALAAGDPRFDAPHEGLALSWGEVVFSGTAQNRRRGFKVRVAGRVDAASLGAVRFDPAEGEAIALLAPRLRREGGDTEGGEPLAVRGSLGIEGAATRAAARELDAGRGLFFEPLAGGGSCGFDLLRGASGDPVAIVAAAIGARPVRVQIGPLALDLVWFVLLLGAVILAASHFLGSVVTEGVTRPLARMLRGAMERVEGARLAARPATGGRDDAEDEVTSLESSFERLWDELALRGRQQALLVELIGAMAQPGDLGERASRALRFVRELLGGQALACYLVDPVDESLARVAELNEGNESPLPARLELAVARAWLLDRRPRSLPTAQLPPEAQPWGGKAARLVILPLELGVRATGLILLRDHSPDDALAARDPALVAGVVGQVAAGIERARLETRTIEEPETGLFVHAYFVARVQEEVDRAAHDRKAVAVVQARLDLAGADDPAQRDEVRRVAATCARELRRIGRDREVVGRCATLEFELLVPSGGRARAEEVANELRQRLADAQALGPELAARLRTAVVAFPEEARSADFLFALLRRRLDASVATDVVPRGAATLERFQRRFPEFGFGSPRMEPVLRQLEKAAASDATVLLTGETGTGKEVAAHLLHRLGPRVDGPFVSVHCAAIPETLLESELFGHEKGAFTGADQRRLGRFEEAHGGTLLLDEIAEIPLETQVKLLRVLQERRLRRLGGSEEIAVDVRLVTATNQSLDRAVAGGRFREDLLYRLKVVTIELPPLRERLDEIPQLADRFLAMRRAADPTCVVRGIEPAALDLLARHSWPGNVRELRNVIERAVVLGDGEWVRREDLEIPTARNGGAATPSRAFAPIGRASPVGGGGGAADVAAPASSAPGNELTERLRRVVEMVAAAGGSLTSKRYCEQASISQRTALRDLSELVELGWLVREGTRRGAVYRVRDRSQGGAADAPTLLRADAPVVSKE